MPKFLAIGFAADKSKLDLFANKFKSKDFKIEICDSPDSIYERLKLVTLNEYLFVVIVLSQDDPMLYQKYKHYCNEKGIRMIIEFLML